MLHRRVLRILILPLLFLLKIEAATALPIDAKLLDANISQYRSMLQDLQKHPDPDPLQRSLQEALLNRLIAISQSKIPVTGDPLLRSISQPLKDAQTFQNIIPSILKAHLEQYRLRREIAQRQKELDELAKELKDPAHYHKDPRTLHLQHLYTAKILRQDRRRLEAFDRAIASFRERLLDAIDGMRFDRKSLERKLAEEKKHLQTLDQNYEDLRLEKERLEILGDRGKELQQVLQGLQGIEKARRDLTTQELETLAMLYADALKAKSERAFLYQRQLESLLRQMHYPPEMVQGLDSLLLRLTRRRLGIAATLTRAADQELKHSLDLFWQKLNAPLLTVGQSSISLLKLALALLIFIFGYLIAWFYKRSINRIDAHNLTTGTRTLLANMGFYLIVIIAFFATLRFMGISLTNLAIVAGALSVGIGFGLQNIVSNFVSGIILMFERSIKIGDYIELDDGLSGYVSDIRMRSVTITTNSNIDIIVPNQQLIQNRVINWTMNDKIRRFEIPFDVAYGTPVEEVIRVVMEAVGRSGFQDIYTSKDRQTQVVMTEMGDSSVNFKLFVWVKGPKTLWPQRTVSRFLVLIYTALNEAGIEIPFPQRDLHLRSVEGTIPVRIVTAEEERPIVEKAPSDA
jgi:small-conductance mechanosensitive channel